MKRLLSLVVIGLMWAAAAPLVAQTVDISGKWEFTQDFGSQTVTKIYTIEQTGEKLVIKRTNKDGQEVKAEGTIKGNKVEWSEVGNINGNELTIVTTGTVEGDKMSGDVDFGGQAEFSWTAVKKS